MHSISVGTNFWSYNSKIGCFDPKTICECNMHTLTIDNCQVLDPQILASVESNSLKGETVKYSETTRDHAKVKFPVLTLKKQT